MSTVDNTNELIKARLKLGGKPTDVAEEFGVNVQKVYSINRKLRSETDNDTIAEAVLVTKEASPEILAAVVQEMKDKAPVEVHAELDKIEEGLTGLQKLDERFHETMQKVLTKADEFLDATSSITEWQMVTNTVAQAYESIFTKGTNIHIGDNNNMSSQRLTVFKANMGV